MTPLQRAEFANAAFLHVFWKKITAREAEKAISALNAFIGSGLLRTADLPAESYDRSIDLARRHGPTLGVRTLDSLHVACALELGAEKFWTFDERQARLAQAVGLDTEA
jgi:predicted nucleic acid-binding protein